MKQNEKASQAARQVRKRTFSFILCLKWTNTKISLRRNRTGFPDEWRAYNPMRVRVSVPSAGRGIPCEQLPSVLRCWPELTSLRVT